MKQEVSFMYTGRKIILEQPTEADAAILQKWYLNKAFRHWYDSYVSVSLDMIQEEIRSGRSITDPSATRVDFIVRNKRNNEPRTVMRKSPWALPMKTSGWLALAWT